MNDNTDYAQAGRDYAMRCIQNGDTAVFMQNGPSADAQQRFNNEILAEQRRQEDTRRAEEARNNQGNLF